MEHIVTMIHRTAILTQKQILSLLFAVKELKHHNQTIYCLPYMRIVSQMYTKIVFDAFCIEL